MGFQDSLEGWYEHQWSRFEADIARDRHLSQDEKDHHKARHQTYYQSLRYPNPKRSNNAYVPPKRKLHPIVDQIGTDV